MNIFFIFLVGVVVGFLVGKKLAPPPPRLAGSVLSLGKGRKEKTAEGLQEINEGRKQKAEEEREQVLELFAKHAEVRNDEVEKLLGVSDATATRHLSVLEADGKIEQVGDTGRGVVYRRRW